MSQSGSVHPDQDVRVDDVPQLVLHRHRVQLDPVDAEVWMSETDVVDQLSLVGDLPSELAGRIARMSDVVPPPDEQDRRTLAVQESISGHVESVGGEEELPKFFQQWRISVEHQ